MREAPNEYKALGLQLGTSFPFVSYVIIKQHVSEQTKAGLFVAGLPYSISTDTLTTVFSCFGVVTGVVLHPSKVRIATFMTQRVCQLLLVGT
jgi:hypothetical protein